MASGMSCWKRASWTPATHSVRAKYVAAWSPPRLTFTRVIYEKFRNFAERPSFLGGYTRSVRRPPPGPSNAFLERRG